MNKPNKAASSWCWRRRISADESDLWIGRLQAVEGLSWALTERPGQSRLLLEVYAKDRSSVISLVRQRGGRVRSVNAREWIQSRPGIPIQLGKRLLITHDRPRAGEKLALPCLHIPHGLAFGSGEHATTRMLLQALASHKNWENTHVLDLGTGSGILALSARRLGAQRIVATDFDAEAIRTARQNEDLNFSVARIVWKCADVKRLRATTRFDLVTANLFSGILCEAASQISKVVSRGGLLWLSGVLRSQQDEVVAAYRRQPMHLARIVSRGKWVMLQWTRR